MKEDPFAWKNSNTMLMAPFRYCHGGGMKSIRQIGTLDPSRKVEAETIAWAESVKTAKDSISGSIYLTDINNRGCHLKEEWLQT